MINATLLCGDVRAVLATLPERSVQTCITSPPYFGLRDYGTAEWEGGEATCDHDVRRWDGPKQTQGAMSGHASKADRLDRRECRCGARRVDNQIGLEPTPEAYVAALVEVFRQVKRVLRDDGTLWLNLGDSYGAAGGDIFSGFNARWSGTGLDGGKQAATGKNASSITQRDTGLRPKNLLGIPWRVAFALQADGWYLRSDIVWAKPNPMPESVTDRPTKSHEYLFLLTKSERYYYDAQAIAEPASVPVDEFVPAKGQNSFRDNPALPQNGHTRARSGGGQLGQPGTRNARSVWTIATQPYSGAHFATFPEELARRCILAGSSAKACESCGAPWERVTERDKPPEYAGGKAALLRATGAANHRTASGPSGNGLNVQPTRTLGVAPTCACEANTGAATSTVLDPFGGSGTTAAVAVGHGRQAIHIELNPAYIDLARERIGPMLCQEAA